MKTLILDCSRPTEYCTHLVASAELTEEFIALVKRLHQAVIGVGEDVELSVRDYNAVYYEQRAGDGELDAVCGSDPFYAREPERTECDRLHVDKNDFWFSCLLKYEEAGEHTTTRWPIKELG